MWRLVCVVGLSAAACGDNLVRPIDARVADGAPMIDGMVAIDGPSVDPPDLPKGPVTLTVTLSDGTPDPGVRVYFQNTDSSLVASTTTDAAGTASAVMAPFGYVTAIGAYAPPGTAIPGDVETFAGVLPGDQLQLSQPASVTGVSVTVLAPPDPEPGAAEYYAWTTCSGSSWQPLEATTSSGQTRWTGSIWLDCSVADILVASYEGEDHPLGYIYAPATAVADQATIDLTAMTYVPMTPSDFLIYDVPGNDENVSVVESVTTSRGDLFNAWVPSSFMPGPPIRFSLATPLVEGASDVVHVSGRGSVVLWGPHASAYVLDYGAHLVPEIATSPSFDPTTHQLHWTESGGGLAAQVVRASGHVYRPVASSGWFWWLAAPHSTTITFPTLPVDQFDYNVRPGDGFSVDTLITANVPGGYSAVRAKLFMLPEGTFGGLDGLVSPVPGFASFAQLDTSNLAARRAPGAPAGPRKNPKAQAPRRGH